MLPWEFKIQNAASCGSRLYAHAAMDHRKTWPSDCVLVLLCSGPAQPIVLSHRSLQHQGQSVYWLGRGGIYILHKEGRDSGAGVASFPLCPCHSVVPTRWEALAASFITFPSPRSSFPQLSL